MEIPVKDVTCDRCGHQWMSEAKGYSVSCSHCHNSIPIKRIETEYIQSNVTCPRCEYSWFSCALSYIIMCCGCGKKFINPHRSRYSTESFK